VSDIFISYARKTAKQAARLAEALRALGYGVWSDDDLPAHRAYADVIQERLKAAKAVVVIWSAEAARSEWVQSEADGARADRKLVQLTIDGSPLPMPFDRIQCADLTGWAGDLDAPGWRKVVASIAELVGGTGVTPAPVAKAPPPLPAKPSIAVMPFANLSGDPEQEYFADGMVEEIVAALTRVRSIFVIASGSGLSFKGKGASAQEAARELGVRFIREGSVRKAGSRVRIAVKLMDAVDGSQVWADRFEDTLEDVFALQDKVALAVAGKIEPTVQQAEIRRATLRPTDNVGAYDLYLRALFHYRAWSRAGVSATLDLLGAAIALDPDFAPALALAAACHHFVHLFEWSDDPRANRREGVDLAYRVVKAAPDDAYLLAWCAVILAYLEGDLDACVGLVERAIALNPGSAFVWLASAGIRTKIGSPDLAIEHLEAPIRLDPVGPDRPLQMLYLAVARFEQGRFADAVPPLREFAQSTGHPSGPAFLAASYGHLGRTNEAREALAQYRAMSGRSLDPYAREAMGDRSHVKLFMDGIALAEEAPPSGSGGAS